MEIKRCGVIIAARMGSRRLPGKALLPLKGIPMIVFLLRRLKQSEKIKKFIFATTALKEDDQLVRQVKNEKIEIFRGSCDDVVDRYMHAADQHELDYVIRVTGDCPMVDGESLDYCIELCEKLDDYDLATTKGYFPVGIDFEIYQSRSMKRLNESDLTKEEREHLTLGFYNRRNQFKISPILPPENWPNYDIPFTVDTEDDYRFVCSVVDSQQNIYFGIPTILKTANMQGKAQRLLA